MLAKLSVDRHYIAYSLAELANTNLFQGEYARVQPLVEESIVLFRELGNTHGIAYSLAALAGSMFSQGKLARAQVLAEESLTLYREVGVKADVATVLALLGKIALYQDDTGAARSLIEKSLALCQEIENKQFFSWSLSLLGKVKVRQGDFASARGLYEESLRIAIGVGGKVSIPTYLEGLAGVVAIQGEIVWAAQLWGAAEALRDAMGTPIPPIDRTDYEHAVVSARDQLGEKAFAAAWSQGRNMTPEQALAAQGQAILPQPIPAEPVSTQPVKSTATYPDGLTAREVEVLSLVAKGLTDAHIAEQLIISPRTVNTHLTSIYGKIQVSSRSGATRYAIEHKLV